MARISGLSPVFPVPDMDRTAAFYENLGFRVEKLDQAEARAHLTLDGAEIVLTCSGGREVQPNRALYGSGCDAYLYAPDPCALYEEYRKKNVKFARPLNEAEGGPEFIVEDADERWVSFSLKRANAPQLSLSALPGAFTVCKPRAAVWTDRPFHFLARTDSERSLVCPTADAPADCEAREDGWRGLRVDGVLDFSLIGILARLSSALAAAGISIFAASTYDTDYLFVRAADFDRAAGALREAGCMVGADK